MNDPRSPGPTVRRLALPALFSLHGRVALVTGAARGLGLEIAAAFAEAGAVTLLNGRTLESLDKALDRCRPLGGVHPVIFDVTDQAAADAAIAQATDKWGEIDILVNNAGIRDRNALRITDARFLDVASANVVAPFRLARDLGGRMAARGQGGRIINITSVGAFSPSSSDPAYAASKAGLTALTCALANAFGPQGVTVNAIAPGPFATEYNEVLAHQDPRGERVRARTLLNRWGRPQEIAGAALFLASEAGSFVTGSTIFVDGGYMAAN
jgi:gluconate 5-dehydrogenase